MKKVENIFQKMFGQMGFGTRVPLRSNIFSGGKGYSPIGQTGSRLFGGMDRKSPLLGNAAASNLLSGYYDRIGELKTYQLLDISKLAENFFSDYIVNFLADNGQQVVTVLGEDGNNDDVVTERINEILTKDIKIFEFIKDHIHDYVFYGQYFGMLQTSKDDLGHTKFRVEEMYDPISVVTKKRRNKDGEMEEVYLARGNDGSVYEVPRDEVVYIGNINLRLVNDLEEGWKEKNKRDTNNKPKLGKGSNREKVMIQESYSVGEPLFYSLILKVKELVIKELLVSLISLRDLSSTQIFLLQFDKQVPLESANELCARATKLANNTNELASFLTSQFDVTSFIENAMTQSAKFVPDYNASLGNKNAMLPLDKLSDKLLDMLQSVDQCKANVLGPLGIPNTITDSTSGSKWAILQQSERANSRVSSYMGGLKESVLSLVQTVHRVLYGNDLDPSRIKLHISEKTTVEYNNQINQSESIGSLVQNISNILTSGLQTLENAAPLVEPGPYLNYIQNLVKDIDPNTENLITEETIQRYTEVLKAKLNSQLEQMGIDPSQIFGGDQPVQNV